LISFLNRHILLLFSKGEGMFRSKFFPGLLILMTAGFAVFGQSFEEAKKIGNISSPTSLTFSAFKSKYKIDAKSGKVQKSKNGLKKRFYLPMDKDEDIARIHFAEYKNDLIVFYELDSGESGRSVLIGLDGATNKIKWKRSIASFNLEGAIEDRFVFVGGVGYLAKINLNSGKFIWKTENFYNDKYVLIDVPAPPQIEAKRIIFSEDESFAASYRRTPKKIVFDKATGKILQ
jgi:hypothetical protein